MMEFRVIIGLGQLVKGIVVLGFCVNVLVATYQEQRLLGVSILIEMLVRFGCWTVLHSPHSYML